jgi:putative heme iron utilization protein
MPAETYYDWQKKLEQGYYKIKIKRERTREIDKAELKKALAAKPDAYLKGLAEQFKGMARAVFNALEKLNMTRKKERYLV